MAYLYKVFFEVRNNMSKHEKKTEAEMKKRGRPKGSGAKNPAALPRKTALKTDAPEKQVFVLCNGKPVKNIRELADVMDEIEDHVFSHHVTHDRNDFANWVNDVFKDVELATELANAKDKRHFQLVIYKHLTKKLW
jgi:hypothetical protein